MRLSELDPKLKGTVSNGVLIHDCPVCKGEKGHRVRTPVGSEPFHEESFKPPVFFKNGTEDKLKIWQASGSFPDTLTLSPSINIVEVDPETGAVIKTRCWHGFIQNGEVS